MKRLSVKAIILPIREEIGPKPSIGSEKRITEALEIMLKNGLKRVAVTRGNEVVGMIRLEDALEQVGLKGNVKSQDKRSATIRHRSIIVNERWT